MSEYIDVPGTVPPQKVVNSGRPVTAITNPDGSVSLVSPGGPIAVETKYIGADTVIDETISVGSNMVFDLGGNEIALIGTYKRLVFSTSNAVYAAGVAKPGGVFLVCADEASTAGTGTLTRVAGSPATMTWKAPGDTVGTAVDVSGADTKYALPSGTAGKSLYVAINRSALPASGSWSIKINTTTGAKPMAFTRVSNVITVTETAHNRKADDAIQLFGTNVTTTAFIDYVIDANSYVITPDTRSDASGSGSVFGVRGFKICNGSIDAGALTLLGASDWNAWGILLNAASDFDVRDMKLNNCTMHALHMTNISKHRVSKISGDTQSDLVHINSPCFGGVIQTISGRSEDNLVGIGTTDYIQLLVNTPLDAYNNHHCVIGNVRGLYPTQAYEAFRAYGCANWYVGWGVVEDVYGSSNTGGVMSIKGDTACVAASLEQNACDIEFRNIHGRSASSSVTDFKLCVIDMMGTVRGITFDGFELTPIPSSAQGLIEINGPVKDLTLRRPFMPDARTAAGVQRGWSGGAVVVIKNAVSLVGTVDTLKLEDFNRVHMENSVNANPYIVYTVNTANTIGELILDRVNPEFTSASGHRLALVRNNGNITKMTMRDCNTKGAEWLRHSGAGCVLGTLDINGCSAYKGANTGVLYLLNFDRYVPPVLNVDGVNGDATQLIRQFTTDVTAVRLTLRRIAAAIKALHKGATGPTYSAFSPDVKLTLSDLDRSVPGQMCLAETALGTIPINSLVVNDGSGAANSWKAVHNIALAY